LEGECIGQSEGVESGIEQASERECLPVECKWSTLRDQSLSAPISAPANVVSSAYLYRHTQCEPRAMEPTRSHMSQVRCLRLLNEYHAACTNITLLAGYWNATHRHFGTPQTHASDACTHSGLAGQQWSLVRLYLDTDQLSKLWVLVFVSTACEQALQIFVRVLSLSPLRKSELLIKR
jgi:hypothetical protein